MMFEALRNVFKVPDLRKRLLFTLAIIAVYRLGSYIVVPGINVEALNRFFEAKQGSIFGFIDLFAGGALSQFAIFALGIMPYITASIIMNLLTVVIPKLEELAKEGEAGQKKINQWTRYMTVGLAVIQSIALVTTFRSFGVITELDFVSIFLIVITLVAGTTLIMWLAELVTEFGIGNGMSILITISIISRLPIGIAQTIQVASPLAITFVILIVIAVTAAITATELGQRKIPVQYAKRVVGRKVYGGQSTYIPLKINQAGVIPIIFASSVMLFPSIIAQFFPDSKTVSSLLNYMSPTSWVYMLIYAMLIIMFTYFYTAVTFNPIDVAENVQKYGGFIPGVRPGRPTAQYLDNILTRLTLPGSVFIALVAILPTIVIGTMNVPFFQQFGGISILITVAVVLETMRQLESQLLMRNYEGFFSS